MVLLLARQKERGQDRLLVGHGRGVGCRADESTTSRGTRYIGDLFYLGYCGVLTAATCVVDDSYEPSGRVPDVHTPALNHYSFNPLAHSGYTVLYTWTTMVLYYCLLRARATTPDACLGIPR